MILVDFNQLAIASIITHKELQESENVAKHAILNTLRYNRSRLAGKYGELVICTEGNGKRWRNLRFPYYKAKRKKANEDSKHNWNVVYGYIDALIEDLKKHFPYQVIQIDHAEADDIIAVLTKEYHDKEDILILSRDHDFVQLQRYPNVKQYDFMGKKYIQEKHPEKYLKEHILRGDSSDGVPNYKSDDDVFVNPNKKQSPVFAKKMPELLMQTPDQFCSEQELANYKRNKMLIDFSEIPENVQKDILGSFDYAKYKQKGGIGRSKILSYLINNRMRVLADYISDF